MADIAGLYEKYKQDVLNYLFFLSKDAEMSAELLQDTFLKASVGILTFRYQCSVKTWLFSIARNCYIDSLRKRMPQIELDDEEVLAACVVSDSFVYEIENLDMIKRLLTVLDKNSKTAVIRRSCGYSFKEIAADMKVSENSARVVYHRAIKSCAALPMRISFKL